MNDVFCDSRFLPLYLFGHILICQNPYFAVSISGIALVQSGTAAGALALEGVSTFPLHRLPGGPPSTLFISRLLDPSCSLSERADWCWPFTVSLERAVCVGSLFYWLLFTLALITPLISFGLCVFPCCLSQPKHAEGKSKTCQRFVLPTMPGFVKSLWARTPAIAATSCVGATRWRQNKTPPVLKHPWGCWRSVSVEGLVFYQHLRLFFRIKP